MKKIFVGNKLIMEGVYIDVSDDISYSVNPINDAVYNVFETTFCDKEHKDFLKTMKINNTLYGFIEYHIKSFISKNKDKIKSYGIYNNRNVLVKEMAEKYFFESVNNYKKRVLSVEF